MNASHVSLINYFDMRKYLKDKVQIPLEKNYSGYAVRTQTNRTEKLTNTVSQMW